MHLPFDWPSSQGGGTLRLAKAFLLGFVVGEAFLLALLGAIHLGV